MKFTTRLFTLVLVFAFSNSAAEAQKTYKSKQAQFTVETVADGLERPWSLAFLPNGDMLVTERPGRLRLVQNGKLVDKAIGGLPRIAAIGQGGLLDVILHPDFEQNRRIYISYSARGAGGAGTEVVSGEFDGQKLNNVKTIIRAQPKSSGGRHFGSRLVFDDKGHLFISLGDRGRPNQAQRTSTHHGSVLRLMDDGSIPADNPFVGKSGSKQEIYSYGHRNVQGMVLHPSTREIWTHEHGPRGGDEVNILKKGANFGWPSITYGINYDGSVITDKKRAPDMEQPVTYWVPSIAPSGMAFYSGDKFPQWKGDLFVGALAGAHLRRLEIKDNKVVDQEQLLGDLGSRVRDVRMGPDGFLYVLTDQTDGEILRLVPAR